MGFVLNFKFIFCKLVQITCLPFQQQKPMNVCLLYQWLVPLYGFVKVNLHVRSHYDLHLLYLGKQGFTAECVGKIHISS